MLSQVVIHQHPKTPSISNYILEEADAYTCYRREACHKCSEDDAADE